MKIIVNCLTGSCLTAPLSDRPFIFPPKGFDLLMNTTELKQAILQAKKDTGTLILAHTYQVYFPIFPQSIHWI